MTQDEAKLLSARRAAEFVQDGMAVGLGTGTTATLFIRELARRASAERLQLRCVATSDASDQLARSLGLTMTTFRDTPVLDVTIDGADEVGPSLALIKGGGGALLREKIVASAARQFVIVADSTKQVAQLGKFPLPVEVIQLALPLVQRKLTDLGLNPTLRPARSPAAAAPGTHTGPWITDEGNVLLDCHCGVIPDPERTAAEIRSIIGVVEHGLFLHMASLVLLAGDTGVTELHP